MGPTIATPSAPPSRSATGNALLASDPHLPLGSPAVFWPVSIDVTAPEGQDHAEDLHLARFGADYVIELLGRTGEALPDRAVHFDLKHRDFKEKVSVTLKTDARGRVHLGPLTDIDAVTARNTEGTSSTWQLPLDRHTYRHVRRPQ